MIALVLTLGAVGQTASPPSTQSATPLAGESGGAVAMLDSTPAPAGRLDAALKGLGLDLAINNETPEIGLSFNHRLRPETYVSGPDGLTSNFGQTVVSAAASLPIGGKDSLVDPQTLDKLSVGPTLSLALSRFVASSRDDAAGRPSGPGWQFGLETRLGFNRFDYRELGTLAERSSDKFQYSVAGFLALYPRDTRSLVIGAVEAQRAYKAQDKQILCKSAATLPATDCALAAPGMPRRDDGVLLSLEYRRTIGIGWSFADLAISPKATIDARDGDFGLELPVYLLPLASGQPILPGIKIGYASEKNEVVFGMFLKSSFKLRR